MSHANMSTVAENMSGQHTALNPASPNGNKVLIVEPDAALRLFLKRELGAHGLQVTLCHDGEQAMMELRAANVDLVLQDVDLPGMDGMALLRNIRIEFPQVAVMVLTGRTRTEDLVQALDRGAHDYMMKPFSFRELHARVRAQLRRVAAAVAHHVEEAPRTESLSLSKPERRVKRGNRQIDLTPREFALLEHLVEHKGTAVSRSTLMQEVWNAPFDPSTNIIDVYMKYLRDKIDGAGEQKLIRTVRGVGYMLDPASAAWA
jgi:DNA-binding response OmpR family regulator